MCDFYVSIDTSILEYNHFDFSNKVLKPLVELCQRSDVHLLLSDVVVNEMKTHLLAKIQEYELKAVMAIQNIKSYYKNMEIKDTEVEEKIHSFCSNNGMLVDRKIHDFLTATKCIIVPSTYIQTEEVLSLYFTKKPPFSDQKQNEFKDAYILLSLRDYMKDKDYDLYVVSTDADWTQFAQENKGIIASKNLSTVIDTINRKIHEREEILNKLENEFDKVSIEFTTMKNDIKMRLQDNEDKLSITFSANSCWGYQNVDDVDYYIEDFDFKTSGDGVIFNILKIENNEVTISCPINLKIHVEGNTPLYFYDREDDADMIMAHSTINDIIDVKNSIIIKLRNSNDILSIEDVSFSKEDFDIDLGLLEPDSDFYE